MFKQLSLLLVCLAVASATSIEANYYTIRYSRINCIRWPCPYYIASTLNGFSGDIGLDDIRFDASIDRDKVFEKLEDVVIYGTLTTVYYGFDKVSRINAQAAYRLLPLSPVNSTHSGSFYSFSNSGIVCKTTPCPSIKADLINGYTNQLVSELVTPYQTYTKFDYSWLLNKLVYTAEPQKAIIQGSFVNEKFYATAVYANIRDHYSACPPIPKIGCGSGYTLTYFRDENRCLSIDKCVPTGFCIKSIPLCNEGYNLVGVPSSPNGCPTYYCDAAFLQ
ncbi:hypothetical protein PPL_10277 [Heterostelium album PN500]|uniref:DUF6748 domain-containing protein n=1 Tax=Heterostelium pallidum (strain ATCC 26659 / Pp 5 / PN500) TaxID=670386 RepID=D3BQT9_HETP5|nr:hypothetical protein PPL_10277 [Heterostelium album PN500]EFA76509.1 hypothetical protein PPL_10277 [Heterostelium album PN500]|eukprot:XP_020428641.1 hypothetical protein PPL_10277 [Heterostelium album PN500]